jgi:EAL domain-containing protein (putative c-di-GMP-specific phosphodiesterase class I)
MLEQTCGYIKKWIADGLEIVPISVNFSKLHLLNPNFILNLCNVLDRYEVPHKYIEIELTETMFMTSDVVSISEIVLKLKENGFSVSIDDFGSGYSSLNLLKDIDADAIKLDKDFFNFRHPTHKERVIIESMTDMAKKINMRVICEGVETAEQADFLENIGCDLAQGFLYSKPVLAEDFEKKLYSGDYCYSRN